MNCAHKDLSSTFLAILCLLHLLDLGTQKVIFSETLFVKYLICIKVSERVFHFLSFMSVQCFIHILFYLFIFFFFFLGGGGGGGHEYCNCQACLNLTVV